MAATFTAAQGKAMASQARQAAPMRVCEMHHEIDLCPRTQIAASAQAGRVAPTRVAAQACSSFAGAQVAIKQSRPVRSSRMASRKAAVLTQAKASASALILRAQQAHPYSCPSRSLGRLSLRYWLMQPLIPSSASWSRALQRL